MESEVFGINNHLFVVLIMSPLRITTCFAGDFFLIQMNPTSSKAPANDQLLLPLAPSLAAESSGNTQKNIFEKGVFQIMGRFRSLGVKHMDASLTAYIHLLWTGLIFYRKLLIEVGQVWHPS